MAQVTRTRLGGVEKAGIGRRVAALFIDWFASMLVALLLVGRQFPLGTNQSMLATYVVFFVEVALITSLIGGSFGQIVLGMRVVRTDGGRLWPLRVVLRTVLLCLVIPAVVMDADGRGLHDKVVDSRVIRTARG